MMNLSKPTSIICFENAADAVSETSLEFDKSSVSFSKYNKKTYSCSQVLKDFSALDEYNKTFKDKLLNTLLDGYNSSLLFIKDMPDSAPTYPCDKIGNMIAYQLFDKLKKLSFGKRTYLLTVSAIQFNDSVITDILNPKDGRPIGVTEFGEIEGVTQFVVDNEFKLLTYIDQAWLANRELSKGHRRVGVISINVYQKTEGKNIGIKSSLKLINMLNIDGQSLNTLIQARIDERKKNDLFTQFFKDISDGNTVFYIFANIRISDEEVAQRKSQGILEIMESLCKGKNKPIINLDESDYLVKELREQIQQMQEKLVDKKPNNLDAQRFEKLLEDLEIHKKQSWTAIKRSSQLAELERRTNLANKGLAKIFVETKEDARRENIKEIENLEMKLKETKTKFTKQMEIVNRLNADLKLKIHEFKGMKDNQKLVLDIQKNNENLNREKEKLRVLQAEHQAIKRNYDRVFDRQASIGLQSVDRFENRWKFEQDRLKLIEEEHKHMFDEERAHMETMNEVRHPDAISGEDAARLKLECTTAIIENELLKKEIQELKDSMQTLFGGYKCEFDTMSAASFETFREYREYFESHKHEIDIRYRNLLKDAVTDAIFLSSRNDELTMEVKAIKEECDRLRDAPA